MKPRELLVAKVGGSLYDLPDLAARLQSWLTEVMDQSVLLVPGGGPTADVVRRFDQLHQLGEERAHWLALRSLTLNAHFLLTLLPRTQLVLQPEEWPSNCRVGVLDPHAFACRDEERPGALPHTWNVTSDSLAARVALMAGARRLILLKSTDLPEGTTWSAAGALDLVDRCFAALVEAGELPVQWVNLRQLRLPRSD